MKNLYEFSKDVWFVKLLNWAYGINTVEEFKTFCPVFWLTMLTLLLYPFILLGKCFGKVGNKTIKYFYNLHEYLRDKDIQRLKNRCKLGLTSWECYNIKNYKLWYDICGDINGEIYDYINNGYYTYLKELNKKQNNIKIDNKLSNKLFPIFIFSSLIFFIYLFTQINYSPIDWNIVGQIILAIVYIILFILILLIILFTLIYLFDKFFKSSIIKYFKIFIDMIRNLYQKSCPIISWRND